MMEPALQKGLVHLAAVLFVPALSLPALRHALLRRKPLAHAGHEQLEPDGLYEDEDGITTEESVKKFAITRPMVTAGIAVVVGLVCSIATMVLVSRQWEPQRNIFVDVARVVTWTLLCCQWATLLLKNRYQSRFHLTVLAFISALCLAAALGVSEVLDALSALLGQDANNKVISALYLGQLGAALGAVLAFASFPQRPDVFCNDQLVDQQHTLSLLKVLSFSWNKVVFNIAKERKMEMEDLPLPDYSTRSKNLHQRFLTSRGKGQLWWQLIKVFSHELFTQWTMTLIIAFLALFPQVVLYNFLERLERRQDYSGTDPALFMWVFGLLLSQLLQVAMGNRLKWITFSRLNIPVTSTLQALVFSKALKQYETAAPGQNDVKKDDKPGRDGKKNAAEGRKKEGSNADKKDSGSRQSVINHMKLDSARVSMFCVNNNNFPMALFKLVLAGGYLTSLMGWKPVVAGLGCGALVMPVTALISRRYGEIHFSLMKYRDGKAHLLTEALEGMRQIKYSALEQHWEDRILKSREEELRQYWWLALWQCAVIFIVNLGPLFLASVAFSVYTLEKGTDIRASIIFAALGLFDQLDEAIALLPLLQMYVVEAYTSAVRLEKFFQQCDKEQVSEPGDVISFQNVTVAWPKVEDTETREAPETAGQADSTDNLEAAASPSNYSVLRDVSLDFPAGKLSVITGKTGSGKSLLLAAILGEVKLISGSIRVPAAPESNKIPEFIPEDEWIVPTLMAFVSQAPWVEGGTIRENIVFGLPFCEARYRRVIGACALENDIDLFVDGDETEVGPKGVTLSGGQRWRVALARALYSRAGIIILDDVLSAVDAHVGRRIVDKALTGSLAQGRTRILATHHADLVLPWSSLVVRLHNGNLEAVDEGAEEVEQADASSSVSAGPDPADSGQEEHVNKPSFPRDDQAVQKKKKASEEEREEGRVKGEVYWAYFKAGGGAPWWTLTFSVLLLAQLLGVARTWSLKELAQQASTAARSVPSRSADTFEARSQLYMVSPAMFADQLGNSIQGVFFWLLVYVLLGFSISFVQMLRILAVFYMGLLAARRLFKRMTHAILRAPLRWISTVPTGRILNRFTSDTFTVDRRLAQECVSLLRSFLVMAMIIGTSLTVSAWVIFFGFFLFMLYYRIASEYVNTAREVKRINSISNSPIYDQFSSVLSGLSTIRAYSRTSFYMERMYELIDNSCRASWALQLSSRWMAFRMGMLGAVFVTVVATAVVLGGVNAALAGFSLTFALRYTGALTGLLQNMTSVELGFNACERVLEYTEIETEPEDGKDAPAAWPAQGRIEVDNVTVAYAKDLPDVLTKLNFTIEAGERLGIVGRTGAGKSTLSSVLFRLLEPREGGVRIDGIDIATLKLSQLRSRLAIIPQDPFLFSGTLRSNLDMEGVLEDYELYQALRRVHLVASSGDASRPTNYPVTDARFATVSDETTVQTSLDPGNATLVEDDAAASAPDPTTPDKTSIFDNLSMPISTGGANLSQGQRQLVCLARALLAHPKIVVLDEATSAVDKATDALIQRSIRDEFTAQGCTVLVIAHRLSTVGDFDRVLVLDKGRVAEMGSPRALVEKGLELERKTEGEARGKVVASDGGEGSGEDGEGESGSSTQIEGSDDGAFDGSGSFYRLVQKSAERQKLMEMILGSR